MEDSDQHYAAALIGSNEDLLTEILIRLPVTSILRFKSVSKLWRLLLSHRHFTKRYDNLLKSPGLFGRNHVTYGTTLKPIYVPFDVESRSTPPFYSLDFYFKRSGVRIEQSCNGLLLCSTPFNNGDIEYYVFNPTTKQLAFIPSPLVSERYSASETMCSMALAFHPAHCARYKVVCIASLKNGMILSQVQVYSSNTRTWKICIESFSVHQPDFREPVYCNGAVHWGPYYHERNYGFLYFKLDVEQLQMLLVPEGLASDERLMYFGESRGHLHLISQTIREEDILRLNVYEMLRDHSGWFVKYRIQLDALVGDFPEMISQYPQYRYYFCNIYYTYRCDFQFVDVVRGKEEEETFLVLVTPRRIIRYNVHDKSIKELYRYEEYSYEHTSEVHRYIQTLSSF